MPRNASCTRFLARLRRAGIPLTGSTPQVVFYRVEPGRRPSRALLDEIKRRVPEIAQDVFGWPACHFSEEGSATDARNND